jgi:tetratricopeptide (TPR) repeat protein
MKKFFITFLIVLISMAQNVFIVDAHATVSPQISDIFYQQGVAYFYRDQFTEALTAFKKALLANPESQVARDYIEMTERELLRRHGLLACTQVSKKNLVDLYLSGMEQEMGISAKENAAAGFAAQASRVPEVAAAPPASGATSSVSIDNAVGPAISLKKTGATPAMSQTTTAATAGVSVPVVLDMTSFEALIWLSLSMSHRFKGYRYQQVPRDPSGHLAGEPEYKRRATAAASRDWQLLSAYLGRRQRAQKL